MHPFIKGAYFLNKIKKPLFQGFYNILAHPTGVEPATVRIGI